MNMSRIMNNILCIKLCILGMLIFLLASPSSQSLLTEPQPRGRERTSPTRDSLGDSYNDLGTNCGGFGPRVKKNDGRCGICGDRWDTPVPRAHELGGHYGKGNISQKYDPQGIITVKVNLTEIPEGSYLEFSVCEEPNATEECLDKNVLKMDGTHETRYYPPEGYKTDTIKLRLPSGVECAHCVFRTRIVGGKTGGFCEDGSDALACIPQEEIRFCADIAIRDPSATKTIPKPPPLTRHTEALEESNGTEWYKISLVPCGILVLAVVFYFNRKKIYSLKTLLPVSTPRHMQSSCNSERPQDTLQLNEFEEIFTHTIPPVPPPRSTRSRECTLSVEAKTFKGVKTEPHQIISNSDNSVNSSTGEHLTETKKIGTLATSSITPTSVPISQQVSILLESEKEKGKTDHKGTISSPAKEKFQVNDNNNPENSSSQYRGNVASDKWGTGTVRDHLNRKCNGKNPFGDMIQDPKDATFD